MTLPFSHTQKIWTAKAADDTEELDIKFGLCQSKIIELTLDNFTGTIDFQSKVEPDGSYSNCTYFLLDQASEPFPAVAQISIAAETAIRKYLLIGARPHTQIVMTRAGGTISAIVYGHEHYKEHTRNNISGDLLVSGNIKFKSGTSYICTFDHAFASADRQMTIPDVADDTFVLLAADQAITGKPSLAGKAQATSLTLKGHVTGGAAAQRDVVIQTGNATNPQVVVDRMLFKSNAAQGAAGIAVYEALLFDRTVAAALVNDSAGSAPASAQIYSSAAGVLDIATGAGNNVIAVKRISISNTATAVLTLSDVTVTGLVLSGAVAGGDQSWTNVGDMTFAAGSILASGSTNGNTLLIKANDTTFITLTTGATDVCDIAGATLDTAIAKGTWTASGTWTIPAVTLGGTVSGGNQNINNLGHIGLGNQASGTYYGLYFAETSTNPGSNAVQGLAATQTGVKTDVDGTTPSWYGMGGESQLGATNTQNITPSRGLIGVHGRISTVAGSGGTVTGAACFDTSTSIANAATVTNWYGLYLVNPTVVGSKLTNAYQIYGENITGGATLNYFIYSLGGLSLFTGGLQGLMTPAVTANSQTVNAAPTASVLTAANTKSFTGTAQHLVLPSITPVANGAGITLAGLAISQGAISDVADAENITVKPLVITGAAGVALETGIYAWTGIDITTPAQAANGAVNVGIGLKITGGATAGAATATQTGISVTMAAVTDTAAYLSGLLKLDQTHYFSLVGKSSGVTHGMTGFSYDTNTYFSVGMSSLTLGGAALSGLSDGDSLGMIIYGVIGAADPTDTTPAINLVGGKKNDASWQALAAAETVLRISNYSTTLLDILGNGQMTSIGDITFNTSIDSALVADEVSLGGYEISAGHRALAISQEDPVLVEVDETKFSHKMPVRINGATYYMMLTAT